MPAVKHTDVKGLFQQTGTGIDIDSQTVIKTGGVEVARNRKAADLPAATGTSTAITSRSVGFGKKRRVVTLGSGNDDNVITLAGSDSGSVYAITPTNNLTINLPLIGTNLVGTWFSFVFMSKVAKDVKIQTSGTDNNDTFFMYSMEEDSSDANIIQVDTGGSKDVITANNMEVGSKIDIVCIQGGAAEIWCAYSRATDSVAATIANS